jgi:hypothetical protein
MRNSLWRLIQDRVVLVPKRILTARHLVERLNVKPYAGRLDH